MPFSVLFRIDSYRQHLISTTSTHNHDDQPHPSRNGRSGDEQGRFNPPHGQTGGWEEQAASGVTSVTSSPTMIDDGGGLGEKAAGAGLENSHVKSTHGLVLEDVDEDAEDDNATTRDELIMLARDNPIWMEELRRYLQEEEKEIDQMKNERVARLARWRDDIAIQPT